jgi:sulfite reductase (NADPH) hemoprotein beta-component
VDRYQLWLGGDAAGTRLATAVAEGVHRDDLIDVLAPILARYREERVAGEAFGDFVARAGITSVAYANAPRRAVRAQEPA